MRTQTLTSKFLKSIHACPEGIDFIVRNKLTKFPLSRINEVKGDYLGRVSFMHTFFAASPDKWNLTRRVTSDSKRYGTIKVDMAKNGKARKFYFPDGSQVMKYYRDGSIMNTTTYDMNNKVIGIAYNRRQMLGSKVVRIENICTDRKGKIDNVLSLLREFDTNGRLTRIADYMTDSRYTYCPRGNLITSHVIDKSRGEACEHIEHTYYSFHDDGQLCQVIQGGKVRMTIPKI